MLYHTSQGSYVLGRSTREEVPAPPDSSPPQNVTEDASAAKKREQEEEAAAESARARRQKALADAAAAAAKIDFGELSGAEEDTREPEKEDPTSATHATSFPNWSS